MKYYIDYQTGAGNEWIDDLTEAKRIADEGASYTQEDIIIKDENGESVFERRWYGIKASEEDKEMDIIEFGDFGFYGEWVEIDG